MSKKNKPKANLPLKLTRQSTEVAIENIDPDDAVYFENDSAGISVLIVYETWRKLGQPGTVIATVLVPGLDEEVS